MRTAFPNFFYRKTSFLRLIPAVLCRRASCISRGASFSPMKQAFGGIRQNRRTSRLDQIKITGAQRSKQNNYAPQPDSPNALPQQSNKTIRVELRPPRPTRRKTEAVE